MAEKTETEKLDLILSTLQSFSVRLESLEKKIDDYQNRLDNVELKINQNNLELEKKVDKDNFEEVINELREQVKQLKIDAVIKDSYSKRLNMLIHWLKEAPAKPGEENLGESRADTFMIFRLFLSEGLQIVEPSSISLVDIHRLPQRPSPVEFGKTKSRPIIVKLATQDDKNRIYQSLKLLKFYNRQEVNPYTGKRYPNVYVTDHLPREFEKQRTLPLPLFKAARKDKKKTSWRAENGRYNIYIEGQKAEQ